MKICLVTEEYIPPVKRFSLTLKLAETLAKNHEVHLVAISFDKTYKPRNFILHPITLPKHDEFDLKQRAIANLILSYKVWAVCKKHKIDLIYGWWPVAYWASVFSGIPYVTDMPEFLERMYKTFKKKFSGIVGPALKEFQTRVAKKSEAVITESIDAKKEWIKRGVNEKRLYFAPYGVEVDFFRNSKSSTQKIRKNLGVPEKEFMVMFHGDIGQDDGVDVLLEACKILDIWCVVIGDGPQSYMEALKKSAGKKAVFTGWINYEDMPQYLKSCDLYVAPFRASGYTNTTYPLKQMEAMAAGKPVICSSINAFSKAVEHKKDIYLVKPGSVLELKEAIEKLKNNKKLRESLGKNAVNTARLKFGWERRIKIDLKMISDVLRNIYKLEV